MGVSVESADHLDRIDHLRTVPAAVRFVSAEPLLGPLGHLDLAGIHWIIAGGESGPGARPLDLRWVRGLVVECEASDVPVFVKQLGTQWSRGKRLANHKDPDTWPHDLRIRQYPRQLTVTP
jgi:protein gp37